MAESNQYTVAVVGNPNCGKTTLFNALTGSKQQVGNWPGVTVEQKVGYFSHKDVRFRLVDLPGTYSLDVAEEEVSIDEKIARDYVAARQADVILNIVDGANLERNLYLTSQLLEMHVPLIVVVNMIDVAKQNGVAIDLAQLSEQLNCPVVAISASNRVGIDGLLAEVRQVAQSPRAPEVQLRYDSEIESAIAQLVQPLASVAQTKQLPARWLALKLLEGDGLVQSLVEAEVVALAAHLQEQAEATIDDDIDICIADYRYEFINGITQACVQRSSQVKRSTSDKIDRFVLNRFLGIPIFLLAMYLMFMFTINIGGAFIDFFDLLTGTLLVQGLGEGLSQIGSPDWLRLLLADGIGGGIQIIATFIPIIACLYLFLSALEDSGYMARAAFVMDRAMRSIGLPGKAFVPLIVGFGCNVPAIMATRTMENQRDRILTMVMAPFMSCGARLPVYALFAAAFFPVGGQNVVFAMYLIGIAVAVATAYVMKSTILPGQTTPFVMELPTYHLPTLKGVLIRTWDRTKGFIFRAGKLIVPMVLVLNVLSTLGTDGSYGHRDSDQSVLSEVGRTLTPVFAPMGMQEDNWPAAVGIFTGVLAKEAVVGTLDSLYSARAEQMQGAEQELAPEFDLWAGIGQAFATIPANFVESLNTWLDPIGLNIGDVSNAEAAAENQAVHASTFGAMKASFDGGAGAFAYLLFILLYFPCVAALSAIYRESNMGWTLFVAAWTTGLAYSVSVIFYQAATLSAHPVVSLGWVGAMLSLIGLTLLVLRWWGKRRHGLFLNVGASGG